MNPKLALSLVLVSVSVASAVSPESWKHSTESHFVNGEADGVVVTSLGELRLSRRLEMLLEADEAPEAVSVVAEHDGDIFVASGVKNVVYKLTDDSAETFAEPPGTMVTSMVAHDDGLLIGTGGQSGGLYRVDLQGGVQTLWSPGQVVYVWDILPTRGGPIYVATGPEGRVYSIGDDDEAEVVYEAGELAGNILCLARRRGNGRLLAGTDENGLVVEIDLARNSSRVLLDADEAEVAALVVDDAGGVYAATSDVSLAAPEDPTAPVDRERGKADVPEPVDPQPPVEVEPMEQPGPVEPEEADDPNNDAAEVEPAEVEPGPPTDEAPQQPEQVRQAPMPPAEGPGPAEQPEPVPPRPRPAAAPHRGEGNAVYYIDADGLMHTMFRRPVSIYTMIRDGDRLLLGTGEEGIVYSITLDGDEVAKIADTDAAQVTAMCRTDDGRVVVGTSNKGMVAELTAEVAEEGVYTSEVLDAGQIARWGSSQVLLSDGHDRGVTIATRSGNVSEPDEATWSDWSEEQPADGEFRRVQSPSGRFLQYRLTFRPVNDRSPVARQVEIIRQVANLAPVISSVEVEATGGGQDSPLYQRSITIDASDPNNDQLVFKIEFREVGEDLWVTLAEGLDQPTYNWDTRTVADGTYELRVTASDAPSNPPAKALESSRVSAPVVVDNTSPVVTDLSAEIDDGVVSVSGRARDESSRIAAIHYAVNSAAEWTPVLPVDGICDSKEEEFAFDLTDLKPGPHRISVRVTDVFNNVGYGNVTIVVRP